MEFSLDSGQQVLCRTPGVLRALLRDLPDGWLHAREATDVIVGILAEATHVGT